MAVVTADFEKGTNGSSVLVADTGSQTAWDAISLTNETFTYDNTHAAHGSLAGRWLAQPSAGTSYAAWSTALGTITGTVYGRAYIYLAALPAGNALELFQVYSGATLEARGGLLTTGKMYARDSVGGGPTGTVAVSALNQWIRLEWQITISATVGVLTLKMFNTADSVTADETITASNLNTAASLNQFRIGQCNGSIATSGNSWWLDGVVMSATAFPGPFPVNSVAPAVSGLAPVGSTLTCDGGTWNGTFTLGYQWTRDGANISAATSSTYVTQAADAGHAIGCTVTATGQQATNESATRASSNTITATGGTISTVVGKTGTSGTAVMEKAGSSYTYITGKTGTSGTAVDQKGAGSFTKIKGH